MPELLYEFNCGCRLPQISEEIKQYDGLPALEIDWNNVPECEATWDLISSGKTRGVFQLESNIGRTYSKKLAPNTLELLSGLIAILRPGCLGFVTDGKSMTQHYIDRRHNLEPVTYLDNRLEQYTKESYGILVYQEQAINIAKGIAGFTPEEANALRKAIGKKKADELAALKDKFIDGAIKASSFSKEKATELFDNIEASNRYSFNLSHSISYAKLGYMTAWAKTHFPLAFFCSSLKFAKDYDEIRDLVSELALFDIELLAPSIDNPLGRFNIIDGAIQYGFSEIKNCGEKAIDEFLNGVIEQEKLLNKEAKDFSWYEFLITISPLLSSDAMNNLIACGIMDKTGITRKRQLHEYKIFRTLSKGDMKWVSENWQVFDSLLNLICGLYEDSPKSRESKLSGLISSLQHPGRSLEDDVDFICNTEKELMGVSVSKSKTASKEKYSNIKCLEFSLGKGRTNLIFVVEVLDVEERTIKTGKNAGLKMANLKLADRSGEMECTVFSKEWKDFKSDIVKGNVLLLRGSRNQDQTLRIEEVSVI